MKTFFTLQMAAGFGIDRGSADFEAGPILSPFVSVRAPCFRVFHREYFHSRLWDIS